MITSELPENNNLKTPGITAGRFLLENILSRSLGMAIPPYWRGNQMVVTGAGDFTGDNETPVKQKDDFRDNLEGLSDIELRELIRHNALGYPMVMPLEIENPQTGEMWTLPWEPIVTIKGKNVITRRRVAKSEKRGTIKEHWTQDDYEISIQGSLMDCFNESRYPREQVEQLRAICEAKKDLRVNCLLLQLFDISRIVIEDFDLPFTKGENIQGYVIKAYSDDLFELLIDETALKQK